jgi:PAS domain S-box-containing protein/diguanylate cyclase (GGDEF)-like protein
LQSLSRHILEQIVASSAEGILLIDARDPNLRIAYANAAYESLSGYSAVELDGTSWNSLLAGDETTADSAKVRSAIGSAEPCAALIPYYRKDGTTWLAEASIRPLAGPRGETYYLLVQHAPGSAQPDQPTNVQVDLLQRALGQAKQKIASLSRTDVVSGLMRYEYFLSLFKREVAIARREKCPLAIVIFEIIELAIYRQTFGGNAADSCLRMVGAQIAGVFRRASDLCARCDEASFVVAVRGQDAQQVNALTARVSEKVRNLGLHNPRGQSGRHLAVRSLVADAGGESDDSDAIIAHIRAEFPTRATVSLQA